MIKYGQGENHKKIYCSDGVKSVHRDDPPPPYPQPKGVFNNGDGFNPLNFLDAVHSLDGQREKEQHHEITEVPMALVSFERMLAARKRIVTAADGKRRALFKLHPYLKCSPPCPEIMETVDGERYLRIDCMSDS